MSGRTSSLRVVFAGALLSAPLSHSGCAVQEAEITSSSADELADRRPVAVRMRPSRSILRDATGYNPKLDRHEAPWASSRGLAAALRESSANAIRYPGGTFANSWDYDGERLLPPMSSGSRRGWVNARRVDSEGTGMQIANDNRPHYGIDDLAIVAGGDAGVNVVFHMNMVTPAQDFYESRDGWGRRLDPHPGVAHRRDDPDDWYKMLDDRYERFRRMLRRAERKGIDVRFVELGNEYYFDHDYVTETFPTGRSHGVAANYIADRIHRDFGDGVRVAATASCVPDGRERREEWNRGLASSLDRSKVGYVTMHAYEAFDKRAQYTESSFHAALSNWIDRTDEKFRQSGANEHFLNREREWRVWYTETNANWEGSLDRDDTTPADEARWAQNLADAYSVVHLYDKGNATLLLQFQFNNQVRPSVVGGHRLYNRALALQPFMRASKNATEMRLLDVGDRPGTLPGTRRSVVQGMCFEAERTRCFILNLSRRDVRLDLSDAFRANATDVRVEGYNNDDISGKRPPAEVSRTAPVSDVRVPGYAVVSVERL